MLCEICGKVEASVTYTEIVDGNVKEYHLCEECAREKGVEKTKFSIIDLIAGMAGTLEKDGKKDSNIRCPCCGLSFASFRKNGKLGCTKCYETFMDELILLFRKIHGSTKHIGKMITKDEDVLRIKSELKKLDNELKKAVASEEFEDAAKIRDRMKAYEFVIKMKKKGSKG